LTHDDVSVVLHEADLVNACESHFGVDAVKTIFSNNKQIYNEIKPKDPLTHFYFYNGTGDWKFEFLNEAASDAKISYIEIDL